MTTRRQKNDGYVTRWDFVNINSVYCFSGKLFSVKVVA